MPDVPIRIVTVEELREWRHANAAADVAPIAEPMFAWTSSGFWWVCPTCGRSPVGRIGVVAVSGWDNPQWANQGTREKPTLTPSLGCPSMNDGSPGVHHWWLREGVLVPA